MRQNQKNCMQILFNFAHKNNNKLRHTLIKKRTQNISPTKSSWERTDLIEKKLNYIIIIWILYGVCRVAQKKKKHDKGRFFLLYPVKKTKGNTFMEVHLLYSRALSHFDISKKISTRSRGCRQIRVNCILSRVGSRHRQLLVFG